MKVRIITDDYTSATDGVVAFAGAGWSAAIALGAVTDEGFQAMAVDTNSRATTPRRSAELVSHWASIWSGASLLVKQFDSTLRGNVAQECIAAWRASGRARLLIVPSFPSAGRTTSGGRVFLNGVPLEQTSFSQDPVNPVRESSIKHLFEAAGIPISIAAGCVGAIEAFAQGESVVCIDSATDEELAEIVQTFFKDGSLVWAGSTGLVRAMATILPIVNSDRPLIRVPIARNPWVLIGSRNPISRHQAVVLAREMPHVKILTTPGETRDPATAAVELASKVASALASGACDGFVATGGDTAKAVSDVIGATGISVVREVEPGVPLTVLHSSHGDLPFITKAGGFGDRQTLVRCVRTLNGT